jgi:hypothetical protein
MDLPLLSIERAIHWLRSKLRMKQHNRIDLPELKTLQLLEYPEARLSAKEILAGRLFAQAAVRQEMSSGTNQCGCTQILTLSRRLHPIKPVPSWFLLWISKEIQAKVCETVKVYRFNAQR